MLVRLLFLVLYVVSSSGRPEKGKDGKLLHPGLTPGRSATPRVNTMEHTAEHWRNHAKETILKKINSKLNENVAKNVIMFLGDGLSIPTLAATRVYHGGEEVELSFETLPYAGLSKTYCVDAQTADSACTATAYLAGVKNNIDMIGVTAAVKKDDCDAMLVEENRVESIAKWSLDVGKRTGIVTTSTVTDASPAGAYAKIANRSWQTDAAVEASGANATKCRDITYQLVKWAPGKDFNVILGGGTRNFLNNDTTDEFGGRGSRTDGLNLVDEWIKDRAAENRTAKYVWNRNGLLNLKNDTDFVLGLFGNDNMPYNLERDASLVPSLEEMTEVAINIGSRGNGAENGYFLFVEGGRIDHGHHEGWARKAFDETIEFSKAVQKALDMTSEEDTLIVVTADHSHTMSLSGYPVRGNEILGVGGIDDFGEARLTINYANGPALVNHTHDYGSDDTIDKDYRFPAVTQLYSETHGADDVGIFASGPWAHLFTGVLEQSTIPHMMAYASCVGDGLKMPACSWGVPNVAALSWMLLSLVLFLHLRFRM
ncbi:hypothetical protein NQ315_001662 [Exocentrus adspersus]|uniref:alkaline phosphatase n=1 Tax=Exocentrus adspersus TaxID=1586481 RepID=A0AAV8W974_9CUCU|nr:hypothetical protein NQ315_001662 [Exocentrus adspersus]